MRRRDKAAIAAACAALLVLAAWWGDLPPFGGADDGDADARTAILDADRQTDEAPRTHPPPPTLHLMRGTAVSEGGRPVRTAENTRRKKKRPALPRTPRVVDAGPPGTVEVRAVPPPRERETLPDGKQITGAVDRAVAWLRRRQGRNGSWGDVRAKGAYGRHPPASFSAGPTALVLWALRAADGRLKDPVLKRGYEYLWRHHRKPATSMERAAVLLAVLATAEGPAFFRRKRRPGRLRGRNRSWAIRLTKDLIAGRAARGWRYNLKNRPESLPAGGPEDTISTHLATLALITAEDAGIRAKDSVWRDVLAFLLEQQDPLLLRDLRRPKQRGFAYIRGHPVSDRGLSTGGATACGLTGLAVAGHVLLKRTAQWDDLEAVQPRWRDDLGEGMRSAVAWIEGHWSRFETPEKGPGAKFDHYHWLWALETAMDVTGTKTLGRYGWYAEGAASLLERQRGDGAWRGEGTWEPADVLDTAFAVLFLKRSARGLTSDD